MVIPPDMNHKKHNLLLEFTPWSLVTKLDKETTIHEEIFGYIPI